MPFLIVMERNGIAGTHRFQPVIKKRVHFFPFTVRIRQNPVYSLLEGLLTQPVCFAGPIFHGGDRNIRLSQAKQTAGAEFSFFTRHPPRIRRPSIKVARRRKKSSPSQCAFFAGTPFFSVPAAKRRFPEQTVFFCV